MFVKQWICVLTSACFIRMPVSLDNHLKKQICGISAIDFSSWNLFLYLLLAWSLE